jgi:hypothetical protein
LHLHTCVCIICTIFILPPLSPPCQYKYLYSACFGGPLAL